LNQEVVEPTAICDWRKVEPMN